MRPLAAIAASALCVMVLALLSGHAGRPSCHQYSIEAHFTDCRVR